MISFLKELLCPSLAAEEYMRSLIERFKQLDPNDPGVPDIHLISWHDHRDTEIWNRLMEEYNERAT